VWHLKLWMKKFIHMYWFCLFKISALHENSCLLISSWGLIQMGLYIWFWLNRLQSFNMLHADSVPSNLAKLFTLTIIQQDRAYNFSLIIVWGSDECEFLEECLQKWYYAFSVLRNHECFWFWFLFLKPAYFFLHRAVCIISLKVTLQISMERLPGTQSHCFLSLSGKAMRFGG